MTSPTESPGVEAVVAGLRKVTSYFAADANYEDYAKHSATVEQAISLLEGVPKPWQVALPKITQAVLQEWEGHPELIELTDEGPQWTQNAVDFACMLQETAHGPRPAQLPPDIAHLLKFYNVATVEEVVRIQSLHIQRLQSKLPPARDEQPRNYREG